MLVGRVVLRARFSFVPHAKGFLLLQQAKAEKAIAKTKAEKAPAKAKAEKAPAKAQEEKAPPKAKATCCFTGSMTCLRCVPKVSVTRAS